MNTFLKGLVGAAALASVSFSTANAQDYTWTLDMQFGVAQTTNGVFYTPDGDEQLNATATGSITLSRTGPSSWTASSWNITTTAGVDGTGTNPTLFAVVYNNIPDMDDNVGTVDTPLGSPWQEYIEINDIYGDYKLTLRVPLFDFINKMNDEVEGAVVELVGENSNETNMPGTSGQRRRMSGTCELSAFEAQECGEGERMAGTLTLTSITNVPEPASMAVFGAGLLGLFAARRRRAA